MAATERTLTRRGVLAALAGGTAGLLARVTTGGVAQAAPNPLLLGEDNDAGTAETQLRSDPSNDHATLAVHNETGTAAGEPRPDALRAFNISPSGGAAISAFGGQGTYEPATEHGIAIRGRGLTVGVIGQGVSQGGSSATGVHGFGDGDNGLGVFGDGFIGVIGRSELADGAGVRSIGFGDAQGLQVSGDPGFSTANSAIVQQGDTFVDVDEPTRPGALIIATLQQPPGSTIWVKNTQRVAQGQKVRIQLNAAAPKDLRVGYLVLYHTVPNE